MTILGLTAAWLLGSSLLPTADGGDPAMWVVALAVKLLYGLALLAAMFWLGGLDRAELARVRSALGVLGSREADH